MRTYNLSHNVLVHREQATTCLRALATLSLVIDVTGPSPATLDATRRDLQRLLTFEAATHFERRDL